MMKIRSFVFTAYAFAVLLFALFISSPVNPAAYAEDASWWRGNLHTHSYWSDGNDYPEMIVDWYKSHGYQFLALSDHNILSQGQKWVAIQDKNQGDVALEKYRKRFGVDWIEEKQGEDGKTLIRLKPLNEFRHLFEEPGKFMLVQGEEISDGFNNLPVHLNGTNLVDLVPPQHGNSVTEVMQNNINAVLKQREETGQPMIPHINHPNFRWGIKAEDMIPLTGDRFFEVYNGHPSVNNYGDADHPGTEAIWDLILTKRLVSDPNHILYAVAVDDSHGYHDYGIGKANPGRGWIMVRAKHLTPESILHAMEGGDFYASSGVFLRDIYFENNTLQIKIERQKGAAFTTQFIGTRKNSKEIGAVLKEQKGTSATYTFTGDELYVRAKITSSRLHPNPFAEGDHEMAWTQPVMAQ